MSSIFDVLNKNGSLSDEISKINMLFSEEEVSISKKCRYQECNTLKTYINLNLFRGWEHRGTCLSIDEVIQKMISDYPIKYDVEKFCFLYLELIYNMIELFICNNCTEDDNQVCTISENILKILEDCNKYIETIDDKYYVIEKDPSVTAVVDLINNANTAISVVAYNYISNEGNISEKQKILKILADDFEARTEKLKADGRYSGLVTDLGFLFNNINIRHNNNGKSNTTLDLKNIEPDELEKYYNMTYRRYLMAVLACEELDTRKQIEDIKK